MKPCRKRSSALVIEQKRRAFMHLNRNVPDVKAKRIRWKELEKTLLVNKLVFLDESGINIGMVRRYGRAVGGND